MPDENPSGEQPDSWRQADPRLCALAVAAVGAALISSWPAFTLGAYQTVFFEQVLALWAASTAAFLVLVIFEHRRAVSWPHRLALLLPSVWLLVAFALPTGTEAGQSSALYWLALVLTLPEARISDGPWCGSRWSATTPSPTADGGWWSASSRVALIGFALGRLNPFLLTCDDFTLSGYSPPPGCTPGPATSR